MNALAFCLLSMATALFTVSLLPPPVPIEQIRPASERLPITQLPQ